MPLKPIWLVCDFTNYLGRTLAWLVKALPLASVKYVVKSPYWGGLIDVETPNIMQLYLTEWNTLLAKYSLQFYGIRPEHYLQPVALLSPPGEMRQSIVFHLEPLAPRSTGTFKPDLTAEDAHYFINRLLRLIQVEPQT